MTTLKFTTVDQHLVLQRQPVVASGDKNSVLIQIQLCSMWDGFDVKVAFYKDGNRDFVLDIPLENGECMIPPEMLDTPCVLNIGVWGKDARGRHKTSTMVKYRVHEGTPIEEGVTLIDVRDGTAVEDQVLDGATFYAGDTAKKTGSIPSYEDGDPVYMIPYSETDPTVPSWAKQPAKPKYTAEEVGARPNTWTPTETDPTVPAWAKKPNPPTADDVGARPDTWMPTLTDIGAAPAGFGLGELSGNYAIIADAHAAYMNGWYNIGINTVNGIGASGVMRVDAHGWNSRTLTVYSTSYLSTGLAVLQKCLFNGNWGEWEWVNPSMRLGVEYRTTERYMGKPVYVKLVDFGALPNAAYKDVSLGVSGATYVDLSVRVTTPVSFGTNTFFLPILSNAGVRARATITGDFIQIATTEDMTAYTAQAIVKYTKD